ncbi:MAG TPA: DUF1269 domain-containing protein [Anaerolineae bacterium]|nr:DUF1269 domain-containing protein [Anaerolineae bacterium]
MESNIIVLGLEGVSTAENMLSTFEHMQDQGILTLEDAVVATRSGGGDIEIKQTHSVTGKYTLGGTGIGLLAGLLLGGPIGGLVGGAAIGAIVGAMKDYGIDDIFIRQTLEALSPNSSALFLMGKADDPARFYEDIKPFKAIVATTTLSQEQEKKLKEALAEEG